MSEAIFCLDTSVLVSALTREQPREQAEAAERLLTRAVGEGRLVAPAWAWAEIGSVLRKKVRSRLLDDPEAEAVWGRFCRLPIAFADPPGLRARAWEIARQYALPTLYDAAFLACTEVAPAEEGAAREFWTADRALVRALGADPPPYVRQLGD
ncbi:MAG: type II toxin-antitoxin system VapC family toxin [Chloroflexi bacterium]|nr:type II toxin-antitoxin system VapC family toxin [Chloroflexota bacterium]